MCGVTVQHKWDTLVFTTLSFRVYLIRIIALLLTLNSRCCVTVQSCIFLTVLTPTPSMAHWDVAPHTLTWMWQVPPPTPSALKGPSCLMGTSGPLQEEHHTSRMILLCPNNGWQVFPVCPPTSLPSIQQHHLPELHPRTQHGGRGIIRRVRKKMG